MGYRTRGLAVYNVVPQPTTLPHATIKRLVIYSYRVKWL
jgi:hypothetical protein